MSWKEDIYSQVQGLEKRGRVRCMGKIPKCKKSRVSLSENKELRDQMKHMQNMLTNVLTFIQNRFPGEDLNDIIQAARQVHLFFSLRYSFCDLCKVFSSSLSFMLLDLFCHGDRAFS